MECYPLTPPTSHHQIGDIVNRLTVTLPRPRDGKVRGAAIPDSVIAARAAAAAVAKRGGGARASAGMSDSDDSDDEAEEGHGHGYDDAMGAPTIVGTGPGGRVLMKDVEREKGEWSLLAADALARSVAGPRYVFMRGPVSNVVLARLLPRCYCVLLGLCFSAAHALLRLCGVVVLLRWSGCVPV